MKFSWVVSSHPFHQGAQAKTLDDDCEDDHGIGCGQQSRLFGNVGQGQRQRDGDPATQAAPGQNRDRSRQDRAATETSNAQVMRLRDTKALGAPAGVG